MPPTSRAPALWTAFQSKASCSSWGFVRTANLQSAGVSQPLIFTIRMTFSGKAKAFASATSALSSGGKPSANGASCWVGLSSVLLADAKSQHFASQICPASCPCRRLHKEHNDRSRVFALPQDKSAKTRSAAYKKFLIEPPNLGGSERFLEDHDDALRAYPHNPQPSQPRVTTRAL